jgi:hypothetical protein
MLTDAKKMACGSCGNRVYKLYSTADKNIAAECQNCMEVSIIKPSSVSLDIEVGVESSGRLAIFDGNDN